MATAYLELFASGSGQEEVSKLIIIAYLLPITVLLTHLKISIQVLGEPLHS
jgi:hypothetical protein